MLTLFFCPKAFLGEIKVIQQNAIKSWLLLRPKPEILLLGSETGTKDAAREFGLRYFPEVECNEYKTPLVNSIFGLADNLSGNDILCYINADIILTNNFMDSILAVRAIKDKFLMIGRRHDVEIEGQIDFNEVNWESRLKSHALRQGSLHAPTGMDYFIFSKGLFSGSAIPAFALGRTIWDAWLVYYVRSLNIPVIDATGYIWAIHQNHSYPDYAGGRDGVWKGKEAKHNFALSGGSFCNISNATHRLGKNSLRRRNIYLYFEPLIDFSKKIKQKIKALLKNGIRKS